MGPWKKSTSISASGLALATLFITLAPACLWAAQAERTQGEDFAAEAKLLYRVVACSGNAALPANLDPQIVDRHCQPLKARMERYRRVYLARAKPFLAALRPSGLPDTVVYPFGGGDLLAALTTYPDARRITTLSLELSGDPRRITKIDNKRLDQSLDLVDHNVGGLLAANDSTSETLMDTQQGDLPGQLSYFLVALAVHGFEPVSLRYFHVEAGWLAALLLGGGGPRHGNPRGARRGTGSGPRRISPKPLPTRNWFSARSAATVPCASIATSGRTCGMIP